VVHYPHKRGIEKIVEFTGFIIPLGGIKGGI